MPDRFSIRSTLNRFPWPVLLVWSCLALLPVGRTVELPVAVTAVMAGIYWRKGLLSPMQSRYCLFTLAFFAIWAPMLVSVLDAANPSEALRITLLYLRFFFSGLFVIWVLDSPRRREQLLTLTAWLLLFWSADAIFQYFSGFNVFGYPHTDISRLNGVFGRHLKLGIMLAILSPFLIQWSIECKPWWTVALVYLSLFFVIIAAGSRASWIMFSLVSAIYAASYILAHRKYAFRLVVALLIAITVILTLSYKYSEPMASRFNSTWLLFSGDRELIDQALSQRLPIWEGAVELIREHPVNGVGARNFRDVYSIYADKDDFYLQNNMIPSHPHQYILEIGSETGFLGLAGLMLLFVVLWKLWRNASPEQRTLAYPAMVSMLALWFPLNTHLAFFSSFMGQVVWWLTALYCALLTIAPVGVEGKDKQPPDTPSI
ncbi:MAG: O-antigen ligase family protein [Gammaproteobacteria bacterium]|nr:O-antigen ligase family protein [Gammaproteobacteria bacterium]